MSAIRCFSSPPFCENAAPELRSIPSSCSRAAATWARTALIFSSSASTTRMSSSRASRRSWTPVSSLVRASTVRKSPCAWSISSWMRRAFSARPSSSSVMRASLSSALAASFSTCSALAATARFFAMASAIALRSGSSWSCFSARMICTSSSCICKNAAKTSESILMRILFVRAPRVQPYRGAGRGLQVTRAQPRDRTTYRAATRPRPAHRAPPHRARWRRARRKTAARRYRAPGRSRPCPLGTNRARHGI